MRRIGATQWAKSRRRNVQEIKLRRNLRKETCGWIFCRRSRTEAVFLVGQVFTRLNILGHPWYGTGLSSSRGTAKRRELFEPGTHRIQCMRCELEVAPTVEDGFLALSYDVEHWHARCCCLDRRAGPAGCRSFLQLEGTINAVAALGLATRNVGKPR